MMYLQEYQIHPLKNQQNGLLDILNPLASILKLFRGDEKPIAQKRYKAYKKLNCKQKVNVHERGVFLCDTCSFLAASPDGVVSQDKTEHLLKIKCPYKWRNSTVEEACKSSNFYCYFDKNNWVNLNRNSRYFTQVQGQMTVCKYSKCEFVVYTLKDVKVIEIQFDNSLWEVLYAKLKTFYIDNVTHVLKR